LCKWSCNGIKNKKLGYKKIRIRSVTAKLHLLDLKSDSELMKSYPTKHTHITGVHMTDGCLITAGSTDNTVRFSGLTDPPQPIVKLFSGFTYISGVSITRMYRKKKNDFDEVPENLAKFRSKKIVLFTIKIKKKRFCWNIWKI